MACEKKELAQDQADETEQGYSLEPGTLGAHLHGYVLYAKKHGLIKLSIGDISFELTPQSLAEAAQDRHLKSLTPEQKEKMAEDRGFHRRPKDLAYWSSEGTRGENRGQDMVRPGKPKQRPG